MPTSTLPTQRSRGLLLICLAGLLWGTGGLSVQIIRRYVDLSPLTISAFRTGIAAAALLAATAVSGRVGEAGRLARRRPLRLIGVGLATAAYQGLYISSVVLIGVTVSTVVSLGTAPLALAIVGAARTRRRPARGHLLSLTAALVGLVLVSSSTTQSTASSAGLVSSRSLYGLGAAVLAGVGFATATALGQVMAREESALPLTTLTTCVAAAISVPLAALGDGPWWTTNAAALTTLVYLGTATFALAYGLLFAGLRTSSSDAAVLAALLEPVTAAWVAAAVLGERITVGGVVGVVLVAAAIAAQVVRPATEALAEDPLLQCERC